MTWTKNSGLLYTNKYCSTSDWNTVLLYTTCNY